MKLINKFVGFSPIFFAEFKANLFFLLNLSYFKITCCYLKLFVNLPNLFELWPICIGTFPMCSARLTSAWVLILLMRIPWPATLLPTVLIWLPLSWWSGISWSCLMDLGTIFPLRRSLWHKQGDGPLHEKLRIVIKTRQKNKNKIEEEENIIFSHIIWQKLKYIRFTVYRSSFYIKTTFCKKYFYFKFINLLMKCINIIPLLPFS